MLNLIDRAKKIFISDDDQRALDEQARLVHDLQAVRGLMDGDGGEVIKKWLKAEINAVINKLIETRDDKYISDLKSYLDLLNKLNVQADLDAIELWLQDKLAE